MVFEKNGKDIRTLSIWECNGLFLTVVLHLIPSGPFGASTYLLISVAFLIQIPSTKRETSDNV